MGAQPKGWGARPGSRVQVLHGGLPPMQSAPAVLGARQRCEERWVGACTAQPEPARRFRLPGPPSKR